LLLSKEAGEGSRDEKRIGKKGAGDYACEALIASPPDHEEASSWYL
jgi:hypothetical protein